MQKSIKFIALIAIAALAVAVAYFSFFGNGRLVINGNENLSINEGVPPGVTIIGDSIALGAQDALLAAIPGCYIDAKVSRQIKEGCDILTGLLESGELREYVVIELGTNASYNYESLFTQLIDDLGQSHKLIFVTPFDGRTNENGNLVRKISDWMSELPERYDNVTIAGWSSLIDGQTELLASDMVHMGEQRAISLFAGCVADAVAVASGD